MVGFLYNNDKNVRPGYTPFEFNCGFYLRVSTNNTSRRGYCQLHARRSLHPRRGAKTKFVIFSILTHQTSSSNNPDVLYRLYAGCPMWIDLDQMSCVDRSRSDILCGQTRCPVWTGLGQMSCMGKLRRDVLYGQVYLQIKPQPRLLQDANAARTFVKGSDPLTP